jgi:hypothetical protein
VYTVRYWKDHDRTESYHRSETIAYDSLKWVHPREPDSTDPELSFYYDRVEIWHDGQMIAEANALPD